jgi:ABC-2 type transport system permease protein
MRRHVILAVLRRNFSAYFRSPAGYVFIVVFIGLSAAVAFWREAFFQNNLANLETLNEYFPYLLLFLVPAVAMTAWSDERRQGTDEILLTLPVTDLELVAGKYLAALSIYAVALAFSFAHVVSLAFLGRPDFGVMLGTFLGYGFLGAALLPIGMVASLLTSSVTVAFILGALFCAVPVFLGRSRLVLPEGLAGALSSLGVESAFADFASGVLSLSAVVTFAALAAVMLYLNLVLLGRRHTEGSPLRWHQTARLACLAVIGVSVGVLGSRADARIDLTQERLHSLSPSTRAVLDKIEASRPIQIQAFVSPEVPTDYVQARQNLLAMLREVAARASGKVNLRIVETQRYTEESRQAEKFGIRAQEIREQVDADTENEGIFLGVALTCGTEEVVVPFLDKGLSAEYEIVRSIGTIVGAKRRRVGIAATDAQVFGGFDMMSMRPNPEWEIVKELRKQYEVESVSLDSPVSKTYDCLLVVAPSSLSQPQMDVLLEYVRKGNATLLFDDPFPNSMPYLAPDRPKGGHGRGMFGPQPTDQKGDIRRFVESIGIAWNTDSIAWDPWNPHPNLRHLPKEFVFLGPGNGNPETFNPRDSISSGLQEMVLIFPGEIRRGGDPGIQFTPLLSATRSGGVRHRADVFDSGMYLNPLQRPGGVDIVVGARLEGTLAAAPPKEGEPPAPPGRIKAVFVADLDCISNFAFDLRRQGIKGLEFDNVTFVLNAVDSLAGDESYVELRKRRPRHRTLEKLEARTRTHEEAKFRETEKANEEAKKEKEAAQKRFDDKLDEIRKRTDLDPVSKGEMVRRAQEVESRRLEIAKEEVEERKKAAIDRSRTTYRDAVRSIRKQVRAAAILLEPIPALLLCLFLFLRRFLAPKESQT